MFCKEKPLRRVGLFIVFNCSTLSPFKASKRPTLLFPLNKPYWIVYNDNERDPAFSIPPAVQISSRGLNGGDEESGHSDMDSPSDFTSFIFMEQPADDKVFVAVGREVKAAKSTLLWAMQNAGGKKIVVLHVHQPAQTISILGGKFPVSQLKEQEVRAHQEAERQQVSRILDEYLQMCTKAGVQAEKQFIEMTSIEKGIVEVINQFGIGRLVMGAASDNKYSRKMMEPKSKKAIYVRQHASPSCHIWFVCKGRLINTRESTKSCGAVEEVTTRKRLTRVHSEEVGVSIPPSPPPSLCDSSRLSSLLSRSLGRESSFDDLLDQSSTISISFSSGFSLSSEAAARSPFSSMKTNEREPGPPLLVLPPNNDYRPRQSTSNLSASSLSDRLYKELEQAMAEAENSKRQAFDESMRRWKAEKDTVDAIRKAKLAENLYYSEMSRRKMAEDELAKSNKELEKMKREREEMLEKHRAAMDEKALVEKRFERSETMVKKMEEKVMYVVELFKSYNMQ